ncbi:MAG: TetR/AcrR family transcriptional regulator C-terminal domain-containing protein [Acidimicrobiia bacterium]|jgi:AcrR family transcriptional regulator|nr:TetR/AcrR family transcriptional regulator C-terminal domain-containing protein [Acidimicrobiia bacterium]MBP8179485.1 TetR/AcrR family transcriptional regulator C-terminal domain-containing protein [Acidimicrobiia bacterium]
MPRQGLDRDQVVEAALTLIDEQGLDALTMRNLASRLNVEATSLYTHIENKGDILDGVIDLVNEGLSIPATGPGWENRVRAYCHAYRDALLAHPHVTPAIALRPVVTPSTMSLVETALQELVDMGFEPELARRVLNVVAAFVVGHVLAELSARPLYSGRSEDEIRAVRAGLAAEGRPLVAATIAVEDADREAEFDLGVEMMIVGLGGIASGGLVPDQPTT